MLTEELNIYKDALNLAKQLYKYINDVPKHLRYSEYSTIIKNILNIIDYIFLANSNKDKRRSILYKCQALAYSIKFRLRLFGELKYLKQNQVTYLMFLLNKVQKQIVGWKNHS